jgi:hypothetical protein
LLQELVNPPEVRRVAQKLNPNLHLLKLFEFGLVEALAFLVVLHDFFLADSGAEFYGVAFDHVNCVSLPPSEEVPMRFDLYTKAVLTVIAGALLLIAGKPFFQPTTVAAQTSISSVHLSGFAGGFWAFDTKTGDVYMYDLSMGSNVRYYGKFTQLGKPLLK